METESSNINIFEQKEIMKDIHNIKIRITITEKDISIINKQLDKINTNITWLLRIVISTIVMAGLKLLLSGGF